MAMTLAAAPTGWTARVIYAIPGNVQPCTGKNAHKKAAVHHPIWGGDGGLTALPWGLRHLRMALQDDWGFRPLRRATKGSAFGNRDFLKKIE